MKARVYENGRRLALGAGATSVHWFGDEAFFALGDGAVFVAAHAGETRRIEAHEGAILSSTRHPDGKRLITGGDDGKLNAISPDGAVETIASLRKWVDHVTANPTTNVIVAAIGKHAVVFRNGAELHRFEHATTIGGLALDAKGRRLAATHYGGATLRYVLTGDDKGTALKWAGSHLAVTISPEGEYIMTAMQENELHGWRMPDKIDIKMSGYANKTRSFSWDKRGRWLATSGADCAVVWPFVGKLGPQGKEPLLLARRDALVTTVAFHPTEEILAIGYADGVAAAIRMSDQIVVEFDEPGEGAVTALAWSDDGLAVAYGDEAGRGGIVSLVD